MYVYWQNCNSYLLKVYRVGLDMIEASYLKDGWIKESAWSKVSVFGKNMRFFIRYKS